MKAGPCDNVIQAVVYEVRMQSKTIYVTAFLLACLAAFAVRAAPFCVSVTGLPDQCQYYDTSECLARATQLGGICTINRIEVKVVPGAGRFCVIDSYRVASCSYPDRDSCTSDASRKGAICFDSLPEGMQPNPYSPNPEKRY